jgi:hypothetical protein
MARTHATEQHEVRGDVTQQYKICCNQCFLWIHSEAISRYRPSSVQLVSAVEWGSWLVSD